MLVCLCTSVTSCDDKQPYDGDEDRVTVTIDVALSFAGADSRAVFSETEEKNNITNYTLLVYDGMDATSVLVAAYDLTQMPVQLSLPAPIGRNYRTVMLGNVSLADLGDSVTLDLSELNDLSVPAFSIDRRYNEPAKVSAPTDFTWSDCQEFRLGQTSIMFTLNPNVAKVTAVITNASTSDQVNVTNVRLKSVPNKVRFAQNVINESGVIEPSTAEGAEYIKYDIEKLHLDKGASESLSWYVPQNIQGIVSTSGNRADIAPDNATYVEIDGVRSDFITAAYKIYPGTDKTGSIAYNNLKDFNIYADHQYKLNITITDDGIYYNQDSKVTVDHAGETTKVKCFPKSNCWFIHPRIQRTNGVAVWELPIDRINDYWLDVKKDATHSIDADSEWEMEVIWQDQKARVIHFCDEYGNYSNDGSNNTYHGFGLNPAYITLDNTTLNNSFGNPSRDPITDIYGNVLVGVKKKGVDGYLWSWHLWVTDYCPDYAPDNTSYLTLWHNNASGNDVDYQGAKMWSTSSRQYVDEYGGRVEHYYHYGQSYWTAASRAIWTESTGIYNKKWIMDRNLGAQASHNGLAKYPVEGFGLYYQYGRKDPFPFNGAALLNPETGIGKYPLYDITGSERADWTYKSGRATIEQGIGDPTVYYSYDIDLSTSVSRSWTSGANANPWYDPTHSANDGKKTLFDPCPPGWCIPQDDAFDFMFANRFKGTTDETLSKVYIYFGPTYSTTPSGKFRHYVRTSIRTNSNGEYLKITFPIQGYISEASGVLILPSDEMTITNDYRGYLWSVNPMSGLYSEGAGFGIADNNSYNFSGYTWLSNVVANGVGTYFQNWWVGESESVVYDGYWGIDGQAVYYSSFSPSRGHNIRCVQVPNGSSL